MIQSSLFKEYVMKPAIKYKMLCVLSVIVLFTPKQIKNKTKTSKQTNKVNIL